MNANLQGWLGFQIQDLKDQHLYKIPKILESPAGGRVHMNGKEVVNLSSNNYLGLAGDPVVSAAAIAAARSGSNPSSINSWTAWLFIFTP